MRKTIRAAAAATLVLASSMTAVGAVSAVPTPQEAAVVDVNTIMFVPGLARLRTTVEKDGLIVTNGEKGLVQLRGRPDDVTDLRAIAEKVLRNRPKIDEKARIYDGTAVDATVLAADGTVLYANVNNPEPRGWPALARLNADLAKRIAAIPGPRTPYTAPR
ncbi:hypothetical protein [Tsukamurella tyrosinosolvens]|uniref:hypothetical protein n=1 Tax=Tsukamurella tyrosinosolvens TaxID=57704 RepID=UPI002DD446E8|nr:hypothetical protein [Tsukamurella tyrosinosolvens]MEC4613923.1 hypothetical protein [Tsukamurella tyrosinosolvens]